MLANLGICQLTYGWKGWKSNVFWAFRNDSQTYTTELNHEEPVAPRKIYLESFENVITTFLRWEGEVRE